MTLCVIKHCNRKARYGWIHRADNEYCASHREPEMVNHLHDKCIVHGCQNAPSYNFEPRKVPLFCPSHAMNGMKDVINSRCKTHDCFSYPTHGYYNSQYATACAYHATVGMVSKFVCNHPQCSKKSACIDHSSADDLAQKMMKAYRIPRYVKLQPRRKRRVSDDVQYSQEPQKFCRTASPVLSDERNAKIKPGQILKNLYAEFGIAPATSPNTCLGCMFPINNNADGYCSFCQSEDAESS